MIATDTLTVVLDDPREDRIDTYTDVHYDVTWNRLFILDPATGRRFVYDRVDIVGIEAFVAAKPKGQHDG